MAVTAARVTSPPQAKTTPHRPGKSGAASAGLCDLAIAHPFGPVQAQLTVGPANDRYEQEAETVAERVMRMAYPAVAPIPATPLGPIRQVQRLCPACEEEMRSRPDGGTAILRRKPETDLQNEEVGPALASGITRLRGRGEPLGPAARAFFEPRFGRDFRQVRIHTGAESAALAQGLRARAFTVGSDIVLRDGRHTLASPAGMKLLAHELTHVVQQGAAGAAPSGPGALAQVSSGPANVIQRAGDPSAIPPGLPCPTDITPGAPAGTSLLFSTGGSTVTAAHTATLTAFRATWVAGGGTDNITVHGFASPVGDQGPNWTLSCDRALAIQAELIRLGIPGVRIEVLAHGESTDFGAGDVPNQRVVVSTSAPGPIVLPVVVGTLTPNDNFAGRSATRFGVGEVIGLNFLSLPPRPAADFGGLRWVLAAGGGVLVPGPDDGTGTYTAPQIAGAARLELQVASGATAGRVVSSHPTTIVAPNGVRMTESPGTAPSVSPTGGTIPVSTWGAGFLANVFIDPKDVSFQGVVFGEGAVASVISGSFFTPFASTHPLNTFGFAHGGNSVTGTAVSPPQDRIAMSRSAAGTVPIFGTPTCGVADFLWAIPWEFSVAGSPRTPFATANHHGTSTLFCDATIEKGGAGPFCRRIDGTVC